MTASMLVFVLVALLGLTAGLCFVGCVFNTHGLGPDFGTYSDTDVIGNKTCVAYWPLDDSPGQTTTPDVVGKALGHAHDGTYNSIASADPTVQALFPIPAGSLSATNTQAAAPGTLTIGAEGIVNGDTEPPHDLGNPVFTKSMFVDGGFVNVAPNSDTNPKAPFTIEFWARAEWDAADPPATRTVIDSRDLTIVPRSGFAVRVNDAGLWEALLEGSGSATNFVATAAPVTLGGSTHVALTFDGANARLFVNGTAGQPSPVSGFVPNTTKPLVIGVGGPFGMPRTQPTDLMFFPILSWKGRIQDVAVYNDVLSDTDIKTHSDNGSGVATG